MQMETILNTASFEMKTLVVLTQMLTHFLKLSTWAEYLLGSPRSSSLTHGQISVSQLEVGNSLGPKDPLLTALIVPEVWVMGKALKEEQKIWVCAGTLHLLATECWANQLNSFSLHLLIYKLELMVLAYLTALF